MRASKLTPRNRTIWSPAGEVEEPALLGARTDDLEELLLVGVVEPVAAGQQAVQRVGDLGRAGIEAGRQRDGDHGLLGDHRAAVDDAQASHAPDLVARPELQGVGQGLRGEAAHDVEDACRDLVRAVLLGERAEQAAGAPRLAHDARTGDEGADAPGDCARGLPARARRARGAR